jgi:hypothetical protein
VKSALRSVCVAVAVTVTSGCATTPAPASPDDLALQRKRRRLEQRPWHRDRRRPRRNIRRREKCLARALAARPSCSPPAAYAAEMMRIVFGSDVRRLRAAGLVALSHQHRGRLQQHRPSRRLRPRRALPLRRACPLAAGTSSPTSSSAAPALRLLRAVHSCSASTSPKELGRNVLLAP